MTTMAVKDASETSGSSLLTVGEVAFLTGASPRLIARIIRLDLVHPAETRPEPRFPVSVVPRVRRMLRMHRQLEVGWTSMALVLELLDRIEKLEDRGG
jgi:chaperone modulatory protein CbpM